jgi:hypothetical protein
MKTRTLPVLVIGTAIRLLLAPFTGQPYDMALWTYSTRLWFQTGQLDPFYPTLPLVYYIQLASTSGYNSLIAAGFNDPTFLYHTSRMVEGVFLKLPMILGDVGVFFVILRFTGKASYAMLYFLNPLTIYVSSAWGMYDSIMLLPLVSGFLLLSREKRSLASVSFVLSGLIKLFGFIPLVFLVIDSLACRRYKEAIFQVTSGVSLAIVVFLPYLQNGLQNFYTGFVLRFFGLGGVQSRNYNTLVVFSGLRFGGTSPFVWLAVGSVLALFLYLRHSRISILQSSLLCTSLAAITLYLFSQSEPQWLSWVIPLSLLYSSVTQTKALASHSYFFGVASTFLIITLTQGVEYILVGLPFQTLLQGLEGYYNSLAVYAATVLFLLLVLMDYILRKPSRFKWEIIAATILVYTQAYFLFTVLRIVNVT